MSKHVVHLPCAYNILSSTPVCKLFRYLYFYLSWQVLHTMSPSATIVRVLSVDPNLTSFLLSALYLLSQHTCFNRKKQGERGGKKSCSTNRETCLACWLYRVQQCLHLSSLMGFWFEVRKKVEGGGHSFLTCSTGWDALGVVKRRHIISWECSLFTAYLLFRFTKNAIHYWNLF